MNRAVSNIEIREEEYVIEVLKQLNTNKQQL